MLTNIRKTSHKFVGEKHANNTSQQDNPTQKANNDSHATRPGIIKCKNKTTNNQSQKRGQYNQRRLMTTFIDHMQKVFKINEDAQCCDKQHNPHYLTQYDSFHWKAKK